MSRFPLPFIPNQDYHYGGIKFGAKRDSGGRKHAACDLIAPPGTPIHAVEWGVVLQGPKYFYHGTYSLVVEHSSFIVRYGEINKKVPDNIYEGAFVEEGQIIAYVGKMNHSSMLHFEMYDKSATGEYTQLNNPPFKRRKDLIDPTPHLDRWKLWTQFGDWVTDLLE
jgi:murein DD-endopeptidase MepM/ murein hydrolase activator NlpD